MKMMDKDESTAMHGRVENINATTVNKSTAEPEKAAIQAVGATFKLPLIANTPSASTLADGANQGSNLIMSTTSSKKFRPNAEGSARKDLESSAERPRFSDADEVSSSLPPENPEFSKLTFKKVDCNIPESRCKDSFMNNTDQAVHGRTAHLTHVSSRCHDTCHEKSELMAADPTVDISSQHNFNDDGQFCSPKASMDVVSMTSIMAIPKQALPAGDFQVFQGDDEESEEGTVLDSAESDTETSTDKDDNSSTENRVLQSRIAELGFPRIKPARTLNKANSTSSTASTKSFKWSSFKTKFSSSFRLMKKSISSSRNVSRTIFVKNLVQDITEDSLCRFFEDAGHISSIRITHESHSPAAARRSDVSMAYLEFKTSAEAVKAVQKSGQILSGRVILCNFAIERARSKVMQSASSAASGQILIQQQKVDSHCSDFALGHNQGLRSAGEQEQDLEHCSVMRNANPRRQDLDENFRSSLSTQSGEQGSREDIRSVSSGATSLSVIDTVTVDSVEHETIRGEEMSKGGRDCVRSRAEHCESSFSSRTTQKDLEKSVCFDAANLETEQSSDDARAPCALWPWKWPKKSERSWTPILWAAAMSRSSWGLFTKTASKLAQDQIQSNEGTNGAKLLKQSSR